MTHRIGILIYDELEVLDMAGPFDVFSMAAGQSGDQELFEMVTISPDGKDITAMHGLKIGADCSIETCDLDELDILIIPGGTPDLMAKFPEIYPNVIKWIGEAVSRVDILATICVGALIAAHANIFDGLQATTHHWFLDDLADITKGKNTDVVAGARYVANEKQGIYASAGVSAGIDLSLFLVGKIVNEELREKTAEVMEFNTTTNWVFGPPKPQSS